MNGKLGGFWPLFIFWDFARFVWACLFGSGDGFWTGGKEFGSMEFCYREGELNLCFC